ncbi:hypothetical protein ACFTXJ_23205 [Streptomyces zhihengii]|uniref:hypothetical protein n=1 Tax=Streptomyces zhihengii TaxID=1818004 RepID=UPI00362B7FC3
MRKTLATAATLALAGLGVVLPAGGAQASDTCNRAYQTALGGYFYAYSGDHCTGELGRTTSWDSDWGNSSGPFRGGDTNNAQSILHKGTSGLAVQVINGTGQDWGGGYTCLTKGEKYMSDLGGFTFSSGEPVDNGISSHQWITEKSCGDWILDS